MRWFVADLRTGRNIMDIPVMDSSTGKRNLNTPETLTAVLDMQDPATIALHTRQTAAPGRTCLACANGSTVLGAGPIWDRHYDRPSKTLTLTAAGLWSYFDHRYVLPIAAATVDQGTFIIPDPSAAGKTMPNTALGTYLTNLEYGTIAKRWVAQAQAWTGGNVPVIFEADRVGTDQRNFEGVDLKNLGTALRELSQIDGGPDIRFMPQFTPDGLGIQWALQTGTDASPLLAGIAQSTWDMSVPNSGISNFAIDENASQMASIAWAIAGRSADTALVARSTDTTLTDLGYALLERLDSAHTTVKDQATLNQWAADDTLSGRRPIETWSFTVEANRQPYLGSYWEGDFCQVTVGQYGKTSYTPWNVQTTNLQTNPTPASSSGYSAANTATVAFNSGDLLVTCSPGAADSGVRLYVGGATVGVPITISAEVQAVTTGSWRYSGQMSGQPNQGAGPFAFTAGDVQRITLTYVPTATGTLIVYILRQNASGNETFRVRKVQVEAGPTASPYFDGSTPSNDLALYGWTGTPNASTSTYSTRTMQTYDGGDPYLFEEITSTRRITAMGWNALGLTVDLVTQETV